MLNTPQLAAASFIWIVNLVHRQLEGFRDPLTRPEGALYRTTLILLPGDSLAPLSAPAAPVAIADLLPAVLPSS